MSALTMRPDILNPLFTEVRALKGVGAQLEKPLSRLGLERLKDLVYHLPTGFITRRPVPDLDAATVSEQVIVALTAIEHRGGGSPRAPHRVVVQDRAGNVASLVYFGRGGGGQARKLHPLGEERQVAGRLDRYGDMLQIVHPDHVAAGEAPPPLNEAVYPLAEGLTAGRLQALVAQALGRMPALPEWIEPSLLASRYWPSWRAALAMVHGETGGGGAHDRLAYDELFAGQLAMRLVRAAADRRRTNPIAGDGRLVDALKLPWPLTGAQRRAVAEIESDLAQVRPMLRLLQGDVGAGKTAVALIALLRAVEAGMQGALLAPTEILARQHADTLARMVAGLPVTVALLTGREKGRARESVLMGLADGSIDILVGTHAIFQDSVGYRRLGLAVIDEQHRFGVSQRLMLAQKAKTPPHLLAMTATPIPRTLTLALYGEMDVSRLDELPPGRTPIDTRVMAEERIDELADALGRHIEAGGQAFWVCPLVEHDSDDAPAAEQRAAMLRLRFGDRIGLVHGRMRGSDKDRVMADFAAGRLAVLVATTVIEVGVDVPNASLMVVEAAERFGLAQLHQLRGRVGRGSARSVCILLRGPALSETARARLALMRETQDGFRIAEEDLRLRGAGEMLGTRQSGEAAFTVATDAQAHALIAVAADDARLLVERDGGLEGPRGDAARVLLYLFERDQGVALLRGG